MMLKGKRGGTIIRAALALLLLLPWLAGSARGALENRQTADFPAATIEGLLDRRTYAQADNALRDRLGLRRIVAGAVGKAGVATGVKVSDQVHPGIDGQLFFSKEFTDPCLNQKQLDVPATKRRLERWSRLARQHGKQLLYVVPPDKSTILRDQVGGAADALKQCSDRVRSMVTKAWGPRGDDTMLLLWPDLAELERALPGAAYQPGDSHWTGYGASALVRRVVAAAGGRSDPARELVVDGTWRRRGELYLLMGFNRADQVPRVRIERPGVETTLTSEQPYSYVSTTSDAPLLPGRTLVVHDSFGIQFRELLAPYFKEITYVRWESLLASDRPRLADYDRIVLAGVERGFAIKAVRTLPSIEPAMLGGLTGR